MCIYRLPLGQSIVRPRSYCPDCGQFIRWYDNVPVLSYLILRGQCRYCQRGISFRYPLVELLSAFLSFLVYQKVGGGLPYALYFLLLVAPLIVISLIDLKYQIIPDVLSLTGIPAGFLTILLTSGLPWHESVLISLKGAVVGGGLLFSLGWCYEKLRHQEGLGGGDVKLAAMLGAFFGWKEIFIIFLLSSFLGTLVGLAWILIKKGGLKLAIPYGPFLAAGALVNLFWGQQILRGYLQWAQSFH